MDKKTAAHQTSSIELFDRENQHVSAAEASSTARDAADMHRMGKRQELQVSEESRCVTIVPADEKA